MATSKYTYRVGLDKSEAVQSLKDLKNSIRSLTGEWKANQAEAKIAGDRTKAATARYEGLGKVIDKQKAYINGLRDSQEKLRDAQSKVDTSTKKGKNAYESYSQQIAKTSKNLASATTRLSSLTSQQSKAKNSMEYYKSGLAAAQNELKSMSASTNAYVERLRAEGKENEANKAQISGLRSQYSKLSEIYRTQSGELQKIASTAGKSSEAYRQQEIRVNKTATSMAKAKTSMNKLDESMRKANPSVFDKIKSKLQGVNKEGQETHRTFKEVFMGSALGQAASNALSNIGSQLTGIYKHGMEANSVAVKIDARFKSMGQSKAGIKRLDDQIKSLKYNTAMSGDQVADLQTKMMSWSKIGNRGAMRMAKTIAGIGDSSKLSGQETSRLGASLMRVGSTGKVTASSLSRIAKQAPTFYTQLAKGAHMSVGRLKQVLSTGKVTQAQFQKWMAAAAKYSNSSFKAFDKSQGGSVHRMQTAWADLQKTMTKPLFNAKTAGLQALSKLMTSPELMRGAKAIGNGISQAIGAIYRHRKDITGITKDFISLGVSVGKAVWKDFSAIFVDIAKSFGLIHGNAKKSGSSLHQVKLAMDGLAKNKTAISLLAKAIIAMAAAHTLKPLGSGLLGIASGGVKAYHGIKALHAGYAGLESVSKLKGAPKALAKIGAGAHTAGSAISKHLGNALDKTAIRYLNGKKKVTETFKSIRTSAQKAFAQIPSLAHKAAKGIESAFTKAQSVVKGLFGKGNGAGAFNGLLQSMHSAGGFKNLTTAGKVGTVAAGAGVAVDTATSIVKAIKDKAGSKKQYEDIGQSAGKAIGGGIGLVFFGPVGAAIGAKIGATVGKWAGDAAKKFQNGWNAKKPPKKFWSLENLGWSTHDAFKKAGKWGSGVAKNFARGVNGAKKNVKSAWNKVTKNVGKFNSSVKRNLSNFGKGVHKYTNRAFSGAGKLAKKGWDAVYKHSSKGTRQILRSVGGFAKRYVKTHQRYTKATLRNFGSFSSRLKKNHGNLFTTIGQTAKTQLKIERKRWHSNWSNIHKTTRGIWKGIRTNSHQFYDKLNRLTHGGLGKTLKKFQSFGKGLWSFWSKLFGKIWKFFSKTFGNIAKTIHNVQKTIGKFMGGKLKVGGLHLASGTDWRRRYPIQAIVNDGHDSPATGNREGLIDTDGSIHPFPNVRNLRTLLLPGQEVINARDLAWMTQIHHFARGTQSLGLSRIKGASGASLSSLNADLKKLIKTLKQVRKLAEIKIKVKGAKEIKSLSSNLKKSDKASRRLATGLRKASSASSRLSRLSHNIGSAVRSSYRAVKKYNFAKLIQKEIRTSTKTAIRNMNRFVKDFDRDQKKMVKNSNTNTKKLTKNFSDEWKKVLKESTSDYKKWIDQNEKMQKEFNGRFEKGWKSLDNGTSSIFKRFWSSMHSKAKSGMNAVLTVLNGGISRIDSVVHQFGGSGSAIHRVSKLATGTGALGGVRRAITAPTLALLNDGNDSPETGNKETIWDRLNDSFHVVQGRNVPYLLKPHQEVLNATESRMLGFTHFAGGTGALKQLYELAKKYWGKPVQTGDAMFGAVRGLTGAINSLAQGMKKTGRGQAVDWWTQLWKMVEDKVEDGDGPASGLLKAVEKYGKGHRYVWGAAGPTTFDCSGLVMYALKHAYGINYPHFSGAQYARTQHISKSQARMGDLVFWGKGGSEHVGVYAGSNRYFSAESPSQGIHMNTLDSVVGYAGPYFGRVRGVNTHGGGNSKIKASSALQKLIRNQVGKGFWKTIAKIAEKYGDANYGGNTITEGMIEAAARRMHVHLPDGFIKDILRVAMSESGNRNVKQQVHDVNSGWNDAQGPLQFTPQTFKAFAVAGHTNIHSPYDELLAFFNNSDWRHSIGWTVIRGTRKFDWLHSGPQGHRRFANGGLATVPSIFGDDGPEMAIPLSAVKSSRAYELLGKTISILSARDGGQNTINQIKKDQKEDKKRWEMLFGLLTDLLGALSDTTIKTDVDIDGRTAWQALSKYARQDFRRAAINSRKGYSNGI